MNTIEDLIDYLTRSHGRIQAHLNNGIIKTPTDLAQLIWTNNSTLKLSLSEILREIYVSNFNFPSA